jgi:hypothetical protein
MHFQIWFGNWYGDWFGSESSDGSISASLSGSGGISATASFVSSDVSQETGGGLVSTKRRTIHREHPIQMPPFINDYDEQDIEELIACGAL